VDKALAFDRADRWESAAAMREAVERARAGLSGAPPRQAVASLLASNAERAPAAPAESTEQGPPAIRPSEQTTGEHGATTTTAEPQSSHKTVPERRSWLSPRRVAAAAGLSALLAFGIWALTAPPPPAEAPPAAEGVRAASELSSPSVLPIAPQAPEPSASSMGHAALEPPSSPSSAEKGVKPRGPAPKREARAPATPARPAPSPSGRPKNPLNIELQ
jgi:hypothetical protein